VGVIITKADVLKALEEEPVLKAGAWMRVRMGGSEYPDGSIQRGSVPLESVELCAVCAVGSVMRRALGPEAMIDEFYNSVSRVKQAMPEDYYNFEREAAEMVGRCPMSALSIFFEGISRRERNNALYLLSRDASAESEDARVRKATAAFVMSNFPDEFDWPTG
jgi:hypothetical protein